jgi:uncharacterized protein (TIGR00251 family)
MDFEAALSRDGKTTLTVRVVPGAREYSIGYDQWREALRIKVKAQPRRGRANQDVIAFLSQYFENPVMTAGATSRLKRIEVDNTLEEVKTILKEIIT